MTHSIAFWYLLSGGLLVGVGFIHSLLKRLPISTAIIYLVSGVLFGPLGFGLLKFDFIENAAVIEHITEIILIASVFTAGLLAKPRLKDPLWRIPIKLAFIGVALTVAAFAGLGVLMGLSFGHSVLLGAVLAPTDPVLATEVQVDNENDADPLKFTLTAEAGMNDASAFPFIYLGLGFLGVHSLGTFGATWFFHDVLYKFAGAVVIGAVGSFIAIALLNRLHERRRGSIALYDFFGLGLLFFIYGVCLTFDFYGFVAAFVGGLCFRRIENTEVSMMQLRHDQSLSAETAAQSITSFNAQIERFGEMVCVFWIGVSLKIHLEPFFLLPIALLFLIRPLTVFASTLNSKWTFGQRRLAAWFGIRGVGSLYYLAFVVNHEHAKISELMVDMVLATIALSVVVHGITATPLMRSYKLKTRWLK
jgi:NhaP-type Na+/H+ or K+/H+ antiporter